MEGQQRDAPAGTTMMGFAITPDGACDVVKIDAWLIRSFAICWIDHPGNVVFGHVTYQQLIKVSHSLY